MARRTQAEKRAYRRETVSYLRGELERQRARLERAEEKASRYQAWLLRIDGGDCPCDDAQTLRQWAYEAVTLGKECPDDD